METFKKIGNIYDKKTTGDYYETVGKNAEGKIETGAGKLLDNLIPQNLDDKIVLDLGCGNGRHSEVFCDKGAKKVVAIDLSDSMLEQAKARKNEKQLNQLKLVKADMDDLPLGKDKFDFIFSRFSLMYSGKMEQVVKNLGDALSSGGEILVETSVATIQDQEPRTDFGKSPIPLILTIGDKKVELKNFAYTLEDYMSAFEKAGLKVVIVEQFSADELLIAPEYENRNKIKFGYGIFKAIKEKE